MIDVELDGGRSAGHVGIEIPAVGLAGHDPPAGVTPRRRSARVAVVVATRDRPAQLDRCLESVRACDVENVANVELIVVDNAPSSEATADLVHRRYPGVVYLREPVAGLALAHNLGLAAVRAPIVAFTDDDVAVDRRWLAELVAAFDADPAVACVTGLILPAELDTAAQRWIEAHGRFAKGSARRRYHMARGGPDDRLFPYATGRFGSGANMAFRTALLRELGGFDPALGAGTRSRGGDDLAAFADVVTSGHVLVYEPAAIVRHHHARVVAGLHAQAHNYGVGLSAYLTRMVHRDPRAAVHLVRHGSQAARQLIRARLSGARSSGSPRRALLLEATGIARGPFAYAHAVHDHRSRRRR